MLIPTPASACELSPDVELILIEEDYAILTDARPGTGLVPLLYRIRRKYEPRNHLLNNYDLKLLIYLSGPRAGNIL